jgi:phage anti-repressor protein
MFIGALFKYTLKSPSNRQKEVKNMKIVQINKIKVNIFEEQELKEKLQRTTEEIELILKYQRMFPELLQDCDGFPIDARKLHTKIVANVKEDKNGEKKKGDLFSQWIKRRIDKCNFVENKDFISVHENVNAEFTQEEMGKMTSQKRSALGITTEYNISLDMAKHLAMLENNVIGQEVRSYFILMEKTLRDYEKWTSTREPEKQEYNLMVDELKKWCERKGYELDKKLFSAFRIKESNLINEHLTGKIASLTSVGK